MGEDDARELGWWVLYGIAGLLIGFLLWPFFWDLLFG